MSRNEGGAAFPTQHQRNDNAAVWTESGMSLRDYFAGQALIALMGCDRWVRGADEATEVGKFKAAVAWHAYEFADAMIAAREQRDT